MIWWDNHGQFFLCFLTSYYILRLRLQMCVCVARQSPGIVGSKTEKSREKNPTDSSKVWKHKWRLYSDVCDCFHSSAQWKCWFSQRWVNRGGNLPVPRAMALVGHCTLSLSSLFCKIRTFDKMIPKVPLNSMSLWL